MGITYIQGPICNFYGFLYILKSLNGTMKYCFTLRKKKTYVIKTRTYRTNYQKLAQGVMSVVLMTGRIVTKGDLLEDVSLKVLEVMPK